MQQQVGLAAEELGAVVREALELGGHPAPGALEVVLEGVAVQDPAAGDLAVAVEDDAVVDPDPLAVADGGPVLRAQVVDEQDAGVRQHAGAEGGVATGDEPHPVDDGGDLRVDELLGGGPVEVEVVDDGDVAATQPGQQAAGPPVDLGGAGEPGQGGVEA